MPAQSAPRHRFYASLTATYNLFTTLGHRTSLEDWLRDTLLAPARPLQLPSCSSEFLRSKLLPPLPHSPLNLYGIASLIENLLSLVIAPAALRLPRWHSMATTPEDAASDDDFLPATPDSPCSRPSIFG